MATAKVIPTVPTEAPVGSNSRAFIRRVLPFVGYAVLIFVAFLEITPFALTIANSFKCDPAITAFPGAFVPVPPFGVDCDVRDENGTVLGRLPASAQVDGATFNPTSSGYNQIFSDGDQLPRWAFNTLIYALGITVLRILFDSMAGYSLARLKFPGNRFLFFIILGILMIPGVVLLIPRFIMLQQVGLINTFGGYFLVLGADAFGILLMKQFFESIPGEIEEAAQVDGANRLITFFRIVLPMATPALVALAIFSFQGQWNNFMDALIIVGGDQSMFNLSLGLNQLKGSGQDIQYDLVLAGSVITTLPMAVIFFIFQRYFVEGVSYSGLKG